MLPFFIWACILWSSLVFNYFLVFHYFNKHEDNFHNFKIMEFVKLIHTRSIGLWWGPYIWVFSSNCQLLCLMNFDWSLSYSLICLWWFYAWANLISMIVHYCNQGTLPLPLCLLLRVIHFMFNYFIGNRWFPYQLSHLFHII